MKKYGYCRVATYWQQTEEQQLALQNEMCNEIFTEEITGTKERPVRDELLSQLKKGDTLVVTDLERLVRNPKEGIILTEQLFKKGVKLHILNIGLLEGEDATKLFLSTYEAILEMNRVHLKERIREGKSIAKKRGGFSEGRPKRYTPEELDHAMTLLETNSFNQVAALTKISRATLFREKRKRKNTDDNV